ncbi:ABC transporter permease [Thiohalocapsa marina]|uniref:ABC transporter permease n=1 Tax=Thiohalocapsa marina TaxID=424902 RepID=UPI00147822FA|nr:ABC transporter permease [Thiohalocapsa marina]
MIDLILYKTYADLRAEAAKTYINYLWWVIDPILSMLVFYLVFGLLFQRGGEGFVAFLLSGLVIWNWYRQSVAHAGGSILNGKGLMNQVHVPKLVFPTVTLLTDLTKFALVLVLLLVFLWISGYPVNASYLALPVLLVVQLLLIAGLAFCLAGLVPFVPDLRFLVDHLLHLQFFCSGIFYSVKDLPAQYQGWFYLNPMAGLIEDYRGVLLHGTWPHWGRLGLIALGSTVLLAVAISFVHGRDREYPRAIR